MTELETNRSTTLDKSRLQPRLTNKEAINASIKNITTSAIPLSHQEK